ncbi:MAG: cohesin domain-containing protein [Candidatus Falkowbacteria bacterium]|nr:cohesin domain-containing protein [Candidatus Falkowbacteria bacterium]
MEKKEETIAKHQRTQPIHRLFFKIAIYSVAIIIFCLPNVAKAATFYLSPSSGSYKVGQTFSLNILVSSPEQALNAVSGTLSFSKNNLEALSLAKSGSIINFWVQDPTFSNDSGIINFEGAIFNPGYTGRAGKIVTITFKVKDGGSGTIDFASGTILANDGQGTNILENSGSAEFSLNIPTSGPQAPEATTPQEEQATAETTGLPNAPVVSSPTHPDPNKWYADKNPKFQWSLAEGISGVSLLFNDISNSNPGTLSDGLISSYDYNDVADGEWYFHIRLKNDRGWGDIAHFRCNIDTTKPDNFEIKEEPRDDQTNPQVKVYLSANDSISGIDYYEIQIDNGSPLNWQDDGKYIYETQALSPGGHIFAAKAFDKAGNFVANFINFIIEPLQTPTITEYPKLLSSGEVLVIKGKTYPNVQIEFWLQRENEEPTSQKIKSDEDGNFTFIEEEKPKPGLNRFWAEAIDKRGAKSNATDKISFSVAQPLIQKIGGQIISYLDVIIPIIALILLLIFVVLFFWYRFIKFKKKIRKEVSEAEIALHKGFSSLRADVQKQIQVLEKTKTERPLTEEEKKVLRQLKVNLTKAESYIAKEIEDIEKEVR